MQNRKLYPTFIMIEGVDRTGKTTLQHRLNKATKFKYIIIDRSYLSHIVYNEVYNREYKEENYKELEDIFYNMNTLLIYLYADKNTLQKRLNEEDKYQSIDIEKDLNVYNKYFNRCKLHKISIDTSIYNLDQVFELALNFIKTYEKQQSETC